MHERLIEQHKGGGAVKSVKIYALKAKIKLSNCQFLLRLAFHTGTRVLEQESIRHQTLYISFARQRRRLEAEKLHQNTFCLCKISVIEKLNFISIKRRVKIVDLCHLVGCLYVWEQLMKAVIKYLIDLNKWQVINSKMTTHFPLTLCELIDDIERIRHNLFALVL